MAAILLTLGKTIATALIVLLVLTLLFPRLRIWPTPGPGTWQSYVFWPLFRSLNVLCFAVAWWERTPFHGLPEFIRNIALVLLALSVALFLYAFFHLGRDNSYGAQHGLVTGGIYQWSRNPQNAMLIVVYACLAVAADTAPAYALCAAMILVYVLMVLLEEPWLERTYGEAYRAYCRTVPRFFNWRRAFGTTRGAS